MFMYTHTPVTYVNYQTLQTLSEAHGSHQENLWIE